MKAKQINYRLFYMLRAKYRKLSKFSPVYSILSQTNDLVLRPSLASYESVSSDETFTFLNVTHQFESSIDWNYLGHGKLWAYNLNYFDFLQQEGMTKEIGLSFIERFIDDIERNKEGLEPFPISLRGINWVKFVTYHDIQNTKLNDALYAQYMMLMDHLEYHLLGNHLLENGFSLLFGAYYFNDQKFYAKAKEILTSELKEQILEDGAHFELTPMYHQIMFYRVLDCLNLVTNNTLFDRELEEMLRAYAIKMRSWLVQISYEDGTIPHFNDSTDGIAPTSTMLFAYATQLGIKVDTLLPLSESGYRKIDKQGYALRVDVGEIGPSYIPGHAHSDTLNFELQVDSQPFIVDTGISTYESNERRVEERRTKAHNTVEINGLDQSQVWSSFRVANRAHIIDLKEEDDVITASHDGYADIGIFHQRSFKIADDVVQIRDLCSSDNNKRQTCNAYLHFHPKVGEIKIMQDKIECEGVTLMIKGSKNFQLDDYMFANGFNKLLNAKVLKITFTDELLVNIELNKLNS